MANRYSIGIRKSIEIKTWQVNFQYVRISDFGFAIGELEAQHAGKS